MTMITVLRTNVPRGQPVALPAVALGLLLSISALAVAPRQVQGAHAV